MTEPSAEPPSPVQDTGYVWAEERFPVEWLPEVPVQPEGDTEHEEASVEVHSIVVEVL